MSIDLSNIFMVAIFYAVSIVVFMAVRWFSQRMTTRKIAKALSLNKFSITKSGVTLPIDQLNSSQFTSKLIEITLKISSSGTVSDKEKLSLQLLRAGIYGHSATNIYFVVKSALTIGLPILMIMQLSIFLPGLSQTLFIFYLFLSATMGYYLPNLYIRYKVDKNKSKNQEVMSDFVDLLIICVEAGLGLDAALNKIQNELAIRYPVFARELSITNLEIRAGAGRTTGLKNLALRVDLNDMHNLVSMLLQVDQFGTSVADSLRIQSGVVRIARMQRAEKIAARIPVKMLIPMILFIFPGFLVVILAPTVLQAMNAMK
jgi:tight adherence protein C